MRDRSSPPPPSPPPPADPEARSSTSTSPSSAAASPASRWPTASGAPGIDGLRRPRARRRRRRHLARQQLPRLRAATCRATSTRFSFAPNPELDARPSRPSPRSAPTCSDVAERLRPRARTSASAPRSIDAAWDDDAQRWRLRDRRGRADARASLVAARRRRSASPSIPELPGLDALRAARSSTPRSWDHDYDLDAASASRWSAPAPRRSSSCPRSSREVAAAAPLPAHARRGSCRARERPITAAERALYRRLPGAQRAMRAAHLLGPRAARAADAATVALARLDALRSGCAHLTQPGHGPGAARARSRPTTRRLQAHPASPTTTTRRSAAPTSSVVTDGIAEVREHSIVDRRRRRARGRRDHLRHRLPRHRHADRRARARRATAARSPSTGRAACRPTAAPRVAGFPNLFMLLGPNTGLGHTSVVFMVEAQVALRRRGAARRWRAAGTRALEVTARGAGAPGTRRSSAG